MEVNKYKLLEERFLYQPFDANEITEFLKSLGCNKIETGLTKEMDRKFQFFAEGSPWTVFFVVNNKNIITRMDYSVEILLSTTSNLEGWKIIKFIDLVSARVVAGTGLFTDFFASVSDLTGTNSNKYQNELKTLNEQVLQLIKKEAQNVKANAIIGITIDYDEISGKGKQMFMVTATGTAVLAKENDPDIEEIVALVEEITDEEIVFSRIENVRLKILQMNRLLKRIHETQYTIELKTKLFQFYKLVGQYAKAEDLLFKMLEEVIDLDIYADLVTEGINFYSDLLNNKTDSELREGNLPRDEVMDGLKNLKKKQI